MSLVDDGQGAADRFSDFLDATKLGRGSGSRDLQFIIIMEERIPSILVLLSISFFLAESIKGKLKEMSRVFYVEL